MKREKNMRKLDSLVERVKRFPEKRLAVAFGQDPYTIESLGRAAEAGIAGAVLVGDRQLIESVCREKGVDPALFEIRHNPNPVSASEESTAMVRCGEADVLMKGLVNTDIFLKAVLDKEKGLLPPGAVMTYTGILDIPAYRKLLFISDPAVIPFPTLDQKAAMIRYSVEMANKLGIEETKVSLVSCTEKVNPAIPNTVNDAVLCQMNRRGQLSGCLVDGPLDIFLSCDPGSLKVKGVPTPIGGDADILIFPGLESANSFYKGLMLFADAELAGLIRGTSKPVVLMSRSESPHSKFYCIALACLMAEET
jgi:phosphate butyryltransferase